MIVVLDACVLYPPSLRDLLLTLAALDAFDPRWSDEILDEVARNVIANYPDIDPVKFVSHTIGSMRRAFPEASVPVQREVVEMLDNEPKDRHVAAAALVAGAHAIVTLNQKDFVSEVLREASVAVMPPGDLVTGLLDDTPEVVDTAVGHMASRWSNPSRTPREIVDLLAVHPTMEEPMSIVRRRVSR